MATSKDKSTKKRSTQSRKRTNASGRKDATPSRSVGSRMRSWAQDSRNNVADKRYGELISFILGLILLTFIVYVLVACVSCLLVGTRDQDIVTALVPWEVLTQALPEGVDGSTAETQNIAHIHGTYLAHWLTDGFLGLDSWPLLIPSFVGTLRLIRISRRGSIIRITVYAILLSLWTALAGVVIQDLLGMPTFFCWGGAYDMPWFGNLLPTIGWLGVALILLVPIIILAVVVRYGHL